MGLGFLHACKLAVAGAWVGEVAKLHPMLSRSNVESRIPSVESQIAKRRMTSCPASAETGGNVGIAVDGIAQLWREKGRSRQQAARIYARLAKKKPQRPWVLALAAALPAALAVIVAVLLP